MFSLVVVGSPVSLFDVCKGLTCGFWEVTGEATSQRQQYGQVVGVEGAEGSPVSVKSYVRCCYG